MWDKALCVHGKSAEIHGSCTWYTGIWATVVLFLVFLFSAYPAAAHTYLISTDPASGATLDVVPRQVRLEFTEEVQLEFADATVSVDGGAAYGALSEMDGRTLVVNIPPGASAGQPEDAPGLWEVGYRVTAGDGHPITGSYRFTVVSPAGVAGVAGSGSGSAGNSTDALAESQGVQAWTAEKSAGDAPVRSLPILGMVTLGAVLVAGWFLARSTRRSQR